ncbi:unnamed protein product [Paramecium sonneborni]|uniref:Protein kinase domain-containing protein n=1 Tax=Paramecium sonneborni TaxID=65129 RepID=A0A8S1MY80_9CILI|nr:unnamed protein product [Paramecium sonneborni]
MILSKDFIKSQNLTRIQSTAFHIYLVNNKDKTYFGYIQKQIYKNNQQLNEFKAGNLQLQNDIKYIRKFNKPVSQGFYAFESYQQYKLLSELKYFGEQVILKICQDLLIALFAIHQKGLLGRCFNVHNILLVENQYCVMMEFGFYPDLEFQVPEMVYNQIYNEKVDIFLLGRVIFFLMIGNDLPKFNMNNLSEVQSDINLSIAQTSYSEGLKKLFNKQNILMGTTTKLIHKREKNSNNYLEESTAFDIKQTLIIKKMFEESLPLIQFSFPIIQEEKSSLNNSSQGTSQNMSSLYPPELESSAKYTQLQQDQIVSICNADQNQIQTQQKTQEDKIKSSLLENDLLLSILPFLNSDRPDDFLIWNQIYFYLQLQLHFQKQNNYLIFIAIYGLKKAQIILKREYQIILEQNQNVYNVPYQEWLQFIACSEEYKRMITNIKLDIESNQKILFQKDQIQLKKILEQNKNEQFLQDLLQYIGKYLDDNFDISNFEEIKRSYRYILTNNLSQFDNQEDKNYSYIRLIILMCILINRIFDVQYIINKFNSADRTIHKEREKIRIYRFI